MLISGAVILFIILLILFELRSRRPDNIILYELRGEIKQFKGKFYPRHFCINIPTKIKSLMLKIDAEAKGKLGVNVGLSVIISPSLKYLPALVRAGGWDRNAVSIAAGELEVFLNALVREFVEKHEIDELSGAILSTHLRENIGNIIQNLGLDVISIDVQSIDPADSKISDAIRKRESARILDETEAINQKARISITKAKNEAEKEISQYDHEVQLRKMELEKVEDEKDAELTKNRVQEELKRREMHLKVDDREIELLKKYPELLLLSPQIANLAEAGQSLRNAKTIVSLSPEEFSDKGPIAKIFQKLLLELYDTKKPDKTQQKK